MNIRLSIRARLLVLVAVSLLPPFAIFAYSEHRLLQARQAEVHEEALRNVRNAASELERILDGVEQVLLALLHSPPVTERNAAGCQAYVSQLHAKLPQLKALGVADERGTAWCGTGAGLSLSDRAYFQEALARENVLVVGQYSVGRASSARVIPFGLKTKGSQTFGYGSLDLDWMAEQLRARNLPAGGSITVADREGTIIARQPFSERFVGTPIPSDYMRLVRASSAGTEEIVSQDGTPRILGYMPAELAPARNLYVSVGLSYEASFGNIERRARIAALTAAAGAFFTLLIAWVVGNRIIVRPLSAIAATAARWRQGDNNARTGLKEISEFGVVGANLDRMMDELQQRQRDNDLLSRELEHRVKNLFATVQAIAGMSFGSTTRPAEFQTFLDRLKALGQGYTALQAHAWEEGSLEAVVDRALQPLGGRRNSRFTISGPPVKLTPRQVLAVTMILHELGTNAVKYGALSSACGNVLIEWQTDNATITFRWIESNGPAVATPSRHGFGTRLMHAFGSELGSIDLSFPAKGLCCTLSFVDAASAGTS